MASTRSGRRHARPAPQARPRDCPVSLVLDARRLVSSGLESQGVSSVTLRRTLTSRRRTRRGVSLPPAQPCVLITSYAAELLPSSLGLFCKTSLYQFYPDQASAFQNSRPSNPLHRKGADHDGAPQQGRGDTGHLSDSLGKELDSPREE